VPPPPPVTTATLPSSRPVTVGLPVELASTWAPSLRQILEGDGAHRTPVARDQVERQGVEQEAFGPKVSQVGQVLDDQDATREEHVVGGVLLAREPARIEWLEGEALVWRVVVANRLDPTRRQPLRRRAG